MDVIFEHLVSWMFNSKKSFLVIMNLLVALIFENLCSLCDDVWIYLLDPHTTTEYYIPYFAMPLVDL
jgi:hypothetical protein